MKLTRLMKSLSPHVLTSSQPLKSNSWNSSSMNFDDPATTQTPAVLVHFGSSSVVRVVIPCAALRSPSHASDASELLAVWQWSCCMIMRYITSMTIMLSPSRLRQELPSAVTLTTSQHYDLISLPSWGQAKSSPTYRDWTSSDRRTRPGQL